MAYLDYARTLAGRVGKDAELKYMQSGDPVCNFTVAQDRSYSKKKEDGTWETIDRVQWYSCQIWGARAESAQKLIKKGNLFVGTGTETARAYLDNEGKPAASLDFKVESFICNAVVKRDSSNDFASEPDDVEF